MKRLVLILLFSFTAVCMVNAQYRDAQLWTGIGLSKRITKSITGSLDQQVRLSHNFSFPKSIFTEAGAAYRLNKMIKFAVNYRFVNRGQAEGGFISGNRISGDIRIRYKKKPFVFGYRSRTQREYRRNTYTDLADGTKLRDPGYEQIDYIRNKLDLSLDLDKKYTPYIAFEIYYHMNARQFNKNRYTLGVNLNLKNSNELDLFYRLQTEYNENNAVQAYVIGIGFSHALKGKLIKKKKKKKGD